MGFGEDVRFTSIAAGQGARDPLFQSFEDLGRHVAWFLDNAPLNFLKDLPWNKAKSAKLQRDLDERLLAILARRLEELGVQLPGAGSTKSLANGSGHHATGGPDAHGVQSHGVAPQAACPFHDTASGSQQPSAASSSSRSSMQDVGSTGTTSSSSHSQPAPASATDSGQCPMAQLGSILEAADTEHDEAVLKNSNSKDILSLAVQLSLKQGSVDTDMLLSQMKTFFAAGHDTTASLVAWAVYYLCNHPEAERKLADEVVAVMGSCESPSWQQLSEMKYMNAVLKVRCNRQSAVVRLGACCHHLCNHQWWEVLRRYQLVWSVQSVCACGFYWCICLSSCLAVITT